MKPILLILAFVVFAQLGTAQSFSTNVPSVSAFAGIFVSGQRNFSTTYGSTVCFSSGATVRFPLSERFFATAKGSAIFKTNKGYQLRQWIVDVGPGYILPISQDFLFTASTGLAFSIFLDTIPIPVVTSLGSTRGDMNYGAYLTVGVERNVPSLSSAFYLDAYYSYLPRKYTTYTHNFGGTELFAGIRYFFH